VAKPISADYQTLFLLPPALEDWIPVDHPARFVRAFVDALALEQLGFEPQPCLDGRPPYANEMLLKVWLYGYLNKIRSARQLEKACYDSISLLWLTGMSHPDHNTLWRFWRDNKDAFHNVFKQSVKVAVKTGLVGLALQAVDGTKIQAACSGRTGWTREQMQKLDQALDAEIQSAEETVEKNAPLPPESFKLTAELSKPAQLKATIQEGLKQLEADGREHYHPIEPEARRMKCEGLNRFAYNAQAVVDEKAGVITAAEVSNQENDVGQLVPMLTQAKENTEAEAKETVADSGYGSGTDLLALEKTEFNVTTALVPSAGQDQPYHSSKFQYDPAKRTVLCPTGQQLHHERERRRRGQKIQVFRCKNRNCPVRELCSRDPKGRMLEIWDSHGVIRKMQAKLSTPDGQKALKRRREIVERQFGWVKEQHQFRRWSARGLRHAKAQWSMLCLAINLRILMKKVD
jgi:transposase